MSEKTIMPCPACREAGSDKSGNHLAVFPSGKFACAVHAGDRLHNARIIALRPDLGTGDTFPPAQSKRPISNPRASKPAAKPVDLLSRIKTGYPATVADLWESSPVRADEDLDDAKALLQLFPLSGILWIAPDIYQTGKPEHAKFFRTRAEWQGETFTAPGTRIAPSSFKPGSSSRCAGSVEAHLFTVIETDEIGEGKLYPSKDDFCSLIRWLREGCGWHLSAVVDSGRRSLHAWFRHPGHADMTQLAEHTAALGLDAKFSEPSQPWRLPGVARENATTRQSLLYLDTEGTL